jgi:NAD-dependent deacetylase
MHPEQCIAYASGVSSKIEIGPKDRVFVLTGAGISAESGVRTFRDAGGLWEEHRFEDVASPEAWERDPALVWRFYSQRRNELEVNGVKPNAAHVALAELESKLGDRLFLCTQNVDPLHERAGSKRVFHMHGELLKSRCEDWPTCARPPFDDEARYESASAIPRCACGARVRPHIVWFGEVPLFMEQIAAELAMADVFVTIGSSGSVYPAAGFVSAARSHGHARTVYVGPERPDNSSVFHELCLGTATAIVPSLFAFRG